jgi:colanic acid biosynthesis glycosyl transferase WcaI
MRIVVWGINYAPELIGIAPCTVATCEYLAGKGCDVTMLTTFSYYPAWKKRMADRGRIFQSEIMNGVRVLRCWHYVPARASAVRRILHELSFAVHSVARLIFLQRPDLFIVVSPPLLVGAFARLYCRINGGRYWLHLQDLQPDAAINLGMVKSRLLIRAFKALESFAYRGAWRISSISAGMLDILRKRGADGCKLRYFPNGVEPFIEVPKGRFRVVNRFDPQKFLVIYSGNLGVKQGLQHLIEAMRSVRNSAINLVVCGEGAEKNRLLESAAGLQNVWFKGVQDPVDYNLMLMDADLMVVSLAPGSGNSFFPSKLLSACAAGKPVLAICDADSELASVVRSNQCGVVVHPLDPEAIAQSVEELATDVERTMKMGASARQVAARFSWSAILEQFAGEAGIVK